MTAPAGSPQRNAPAPSLVAVPWVPPARIPDVAQPRIVETACDLPWADFCRALQRPALLLASGSTRC